MSKKSSNFVVGTDYAEEIPTCRDLALHPFLLSEKSEIFRVAMRGGVVVDIFCVVERIAC